MKAIIVNHKTKKVNSLKFKKNSIEKISDIALSVAAMGSKYSISVLAENEEDINLICNSFHNMPVPAAPATKAIWTGDLAIFILLNFPKE